MTSRIIVDAWDRRDAIASYETSRFISAARDIYGDVLLLNPSRIAIELVRGGAPPRIFQDSVELPPIDTMLIRGTKGLGAGLTGLILALRARGCDVLDCNDEFDEQGGSKLVSSFRRFEKRVGSSTYLAFCREAAGDLIARLALEGKFPLLGKPIAGRKGRGVVALPSATDALAYADALYDELATATLLLQRLESFTAEYRVMAFFGTSLGVVKKIPALDEVAANYAQGGVFVPSDRADVEAFALDTVEPVSIFGVDVGETAQGELIIIESNRAPNFSAFDQAVGRDTARRIVELARERIEQRNRERGPDKTALQ